MQAEETDRLVSVDAGVAQAVVAPAFDLNRCSPAAQENALA